jgi:Mg-chelatase subunit ChlD
MVAPEGRANVSFSGGWPLKDAMAEAIASDGRARPVVVDAEPDHSNAMGLAKRLAEALRGRSHKVEDLKAENLMGMIAEQTA